MSFTVPIRLNGVDMLSETMNAFFQLSFMLIARCLLEIAFRVNKNMNFSARLLRGFYFILFCTHLGSLNIHVRTLTDLIARLENDGESGKCHLIRCPHS